MQWFIVLLILFTLFSSTADSLAYPGLSIVTTSIGGAYSPHFQSNADYSRKVSVSVGSVLNQQEAAAAAKINKNNSNRDRGYIGTRSVIGNGDDLTPLRRSGNYLPPDALNAWPEHFTSKADVNYYDEKMNGAAISYLQPDLSRGTIAKLRVILGADYDDAWMSTEPRPSGNETSGYPPMLSNQALQQQVNELNFTIIDDIPGAGKREVVLDVKEANSLRKWLLQYSSCSVQYVWRDAGQSYWPRWIRHAVCKEGAPCSWPSGMFCKPSGTKILTLLKWYCSKQTPAQVQKRAQENYHRRTRSLYNQASSNFYPRGGVRRFTREERRSKRVKRLVRKLSRSFREYYCEWDRDRYTLQPECRCGC